MAVKKRTDFRLLHYSIQRDHVHLIVEADDHGALDRGMKAVCSRIARAAHRIFEISGRVLSGSYHAHFLKTPKEVFHAIKYVLRGACKHYRQSHGQASPVRIDEASSARWFNGFSRQLEADREGEPEVARPKSWLMLDGWKRYGQIDPATYG